MITVEQAAARVDEVRAHAAAGDDERAHAAEDSLMVEALEAIASGRLSAVEAAEMARMAYRTGSVEFSRWCG